MTATDPERATEPRNDPTRRVAPITTRSAAGVDRMGRWFDRVIPFHELRPLARIPSLKVKLSIVILATVAITIAATSFGLWLDLRPRVSVAAAALVTLAAVQILARGTTTPLRAMADVAEDLAAGHRPRPVAEDRVDEIGQLTRSFNTMVARIDALEQQRRDFIANVSHELRTPLAVLQGTVENLADGIVEDESATLDTMARQIDRLSRLVGQLLDLSRFDAGVAPFHPTQIDLSEVVGAVVEEASLRTPVPMIEVHAPPRLVIVGDAERIHQVVANLVDNAIRHGPDGQAVTVAIDTSSSHAVVSVTDRGPGIAPDRLDTVFERYDRSASPPTTGGGVGLGLAIARWVADLHGGTISVRNLELGCRFELVLPIDQPT